MHGSNDRHLSICVLVTEPCWKVPLPDSLTEDQRNKAVDLLRRNAEIFASSDDDLGNAEGVSHKIPLTDEVPVRQPFRRIPPSQWEEVREHIRKLLDKGVIRPSTSPYASPIVLVRKTDGSLRMCVDYRKLNQKTIKDAYPIPRIEDSIDALHGSQWFSAIDLLSGYHQVAMAETDRHKTGFITPFGLYEFNRMPFGLSNAPDSNPLAHLGNASWMQFLNAGEQLREFQQKDPTISRFYESWLSNTKPSMTDRRQNKELSLLVKQWDKLHEMDGLLYRTCPENNTNQLLLPKVLREEVLKACHDQCGHQGGKRTTLLVKQRCYWPKLSSDVIAYCEECDGVFVLRTNQKIREPLRSIVANKPNDIVAVDFTLLERDTAGKENVLIITDIFSKFTQAIPTKDQTAQTTAKKLAQHWFLLFGPLVDCTLTKEGILNRH
ncbi:hypothetical protein BSL78_05463 [Apostichopus japonicus]|uniref:Integrase catalytic domain-containing protein n=1 Tax=Stichopus japonicus TaxID=307972 RepID=A0A2G8LBM4_STIJA|nr:hypothetical protein BSL78_05463 [Apostichopus japonicus]